MQLSDGEELGDVRDEALELSLGSLLDQLGSTTVEVLAGRFDGSRPVSSVTIYDPFDDSPLRPGAVLLGVGVLAERALEEFIAHAVDVSACAIVIRELPNASQDLVRPAVEAGIVALGLMPGIVWDQVATGMANATELARSGGAHQGLPDDDSFDYPAAEWLRAKANALAELLGAPLTIEDTSSRVLAFSGRQDQGDERRTETILRGRVSADLVEEMKRAGHFARIYGSDHPVYLDLSSLPRNQIPRVVMRIASGSMVVGSIWVAIAGPLSDEDNLVLQRAAADIATVMDLVTKQSGRARAGRRQLMARLLSGGADADLASARQGLTGERLRLAVLDVRATAENVLGQSQSVPAIADSLHLHINTADQRNTATLLGSRVYAILVETAHNTAEQVLRSFLARPASKGAEHRVVLAPPVLRASELLEAQRDVLRTLQVMSPRASAGPQLWNVEDCYVDVAIHEVSERMLSKRVLGSTALDLLARYDEQHRSELLATLSTYLKQFGQIAAAASELHIHHNTLRYRLKKIEEISGIDLDDPEARFRTMVLFRILGATGTEKQNNIRMTE